MTNGSDDPGKIGSGPVESLVSSNVADLISDLSLLGKVQDFEDAEKSQALEIIAQEVADNPKLRVTLAQALDAAPDSSDSENP
jgi:hypothetical protein